MASLLAVTPITTMVTMTTDIRVCSLLPSSQPALPNLSQPQVWHDQRERPHQLEVDPEHDDPNPPGSVGVQPSDAPHQLCSSSSRTSLYNFVWWLFSRPVTLTPWQMSWPEHLVCLLPMGFFSSHSPLLRLNPSRSLSVFSEYYSLELFDHIFLTGIPTLPFYLQQVWAGEQAQHQQQAAAAAFSYSPSSAPTPPGQTK